MYKIKQAFLFSVQGYMWSGRAWEAGVSALHKSFSETWASEALPSSVQGAQVTLGIKIQWVDREREDREDTHAFEPRQFESDLCHFHSSYIGHITPIQSGLGNIAGPWLSSCF